MAGYSGTPLAKKLGIKPGHAVALVEAPSGFESLLAGLPPDVSPVRFSGQPGPFDVIVFFTKSRRDLQAMFKMLAERLEPNGGLWVAWPKKSSGVKTDITEDVLREIGLPTGMVDNKVCAIDATWSGLRFVWRLEKRAGARK